MRDENKWAVRVGGGFIGCYADFGSAEREAKKQASAEPGIAVSVYERKVTYTASIVVSDDRPQAAAP